MTRLRLFDRFDMLVAGAVTVLLLAIGVVIARGDQVGLSVERYSPLDRTSSRTKITVTFDAALIADTAQARLHLVPAVTGQIVVNGTELTFTPDQALTQNQVYTVAVSAGIESSTGRTLKRDLQWQFQVTPPQVLYIGPVDSIVQNLYVVDPTMPDKPIQLTNSKNGVIDFDVSAHDSKIAYAELQDQGASNSHVV